MPSGETLLLDSMTAPAVAFSTRKLRTAYSGQCLRVRRSSDNAEQDIGFASNKLDTASLLTFVGAGDGFVVTWYDQSGNGRDAAQATAGNQLYVVQSGATLAWGAQGDVGILNPFEDRYLSYTSVAAASGYSALWAVDRVGSNRGSIGWAVGSGGSHWTATGQVDFTGSPTTTANTVARVLVTSYAPSNKRLYSSAGEATPSLTALGYATNGTGYIGEFSPAHFGPLEAVHHTCIFWTSPLTDIAALYNAAAAWL